MWRRLTSYEISLFSNLTATAITAAFARRFTAEAFNGTRPGIYECEENYYDYGCFLHRHSNPNALPI